MGSYHRHQHSLDDDDLPLEELAHKLDSSTDPSTRPSPQINGHVPLQNLKPRGRRKRYKDSDSDDRQGLLDHTQVEDSGSSFNSTSDDASLLPVNKNRKSRWRNATAIFTKWRSSPIIRIEEEEKYDPSSNRHVYLRRPSRFPSNVVSNAKYTPWSFLPRTLYNEFSFFFNLYFLLVALSQLIPPLRIGYLSTYIAPLTFVLAITLGKEAYDDITRRRRDAELNSERYTVLAFGDGIQPIKGGTANGPRGRGRHGSQARLNDIEEEETNLDASSEAQLDGTREILKTSKDLKVGDILKLERNSRVPADTILLHSHSSDTQAPKDEGDGEAFIRTDQLDGETDWKLRVAPPLSQSIQLKRLADLEISASKPSKKVNEFIGTLTYSPPNPYDVGQTSPSLQKNESKTVALGIDNTAWANTIMASQATVYAAIVYTGPQTRQAMSTTQSRSKSGLLEFEINTLTKILCALTLLLSFVLVALEGFQSPDQHKWYIAVMRYLILFSTIIPISLRVNLDMGKAVYAWFIHHDQDIPGTVVRTSTIPEDLGRIEYLLSDKTGTLTQNDMIMRKIHVGTVSYANEAMTEVASYIRQLYGVQSSSNADGNSSKAPGGIAASATRSRREIGGRVRDVVLALALCHNVTPTNSRDEEGKLETTYQASSPDEIAIVRWTEEVGLRLAHRDRHSMALESSHTGETVVRVEILNLFPFTSDGKRMGIIIRIVTSPDQKGIRGGETQEDTIWFFQKGADAVMSSIVATNDWLDEETANMAREGLRTLVVGRKKLSLGQYHAFTEAYKQASLELHGRDEGMARVVKEHLEQELDLVGVTGVEDKLQQDVKPSLELLRNAGIKIWMLTGDKVETARCIAVSSKLVARGQYVHVISKMPHPSQAHDHLTFLQSTPTAALLIDGPSLMLMLQHHSAAFVAVAVTLPAVIACRCSPTQKADLASLIRAHTRKRICCIGDGGNDVSMIQTADVGVGIVGKEGRQASLAADFSIEQFRHLTKLLVWHGRNSYKRSAKLGQFVMHRGLLISVAQTVYSVSSKFEPIALYKDWLLVGYATCYTMFPVFSLVLDTDIPPHLAHLYPELYAELSASKSLSYRTFFIWVGVSLYQGIAIQLLSQVLVGINDTTGSYKHNESAYVENAASDPTFKRMVSVSFSSLVLNELIMVASEVTTWHWVMAICIVGTAAVYVGSVPFLGKYFDLKWLVSVGFLWRVAAIAGVALVPVYLGKVVRRCVRPPSYRKVQQGG